MGTAYAGMDFGWKSFRYEFRDSRNRALEKGGAPATPEALKMGLEKYTGRVPVVVAYEAGSQMYWIDEAIKEMGQESYPFHAAHFHQIVKSKKKTDKKDAEKIAIAAVKENLPPRIYVPERVERKLRELLTERSTYKKELNAAGRRSQNANQARKNQTLPRNRFTRSNLRWPRRRENRRNGDYAPGRFGRVIRKGNPGD